MNRVLVFMGGFLEIVHSDLERRLEMKELLGSLADALNSKLPRYEVSLLHLSGSDYLAFSREEKDPITNMLSSAEEIANVERVCAGLRAEEAAE